MDSRKEAELGKPELYWKTNGEYIARNLTFPQSLGVKAWKKILESVSLSEIDTVFDCGANIGRNIGFLKDSDLLSKSSFTALDLNGVALEKLIGTYPDVITKHTNILNFECDEVFDLVFTSGVLIHINPENLEQVYENLMKLTKKYCLLIEYFNRTPVEITYRGENGLLWKRDFGKHFLEKSGWEPISYGFLWGHEYDAAGFDDVTYWLFRRN